MMLMWGLVAFVYYGAGLSSTLLGGNIYINFTMVALIEAVADLCNLYIIDHWGRKTTLFFAYVTSL